KRAATGICRWWIPAAGLSACCRSSASCITWSSISRRRFTICRPTPTRSRVRPKERSVVSLCPRVRMICPTCSHDNLPGSEFCENCLHDLTQLDWPTAHDRVERSLMEDPVSVLHPRAPITITQTATVAEAMRLMLDRDIGSLLVVGSDGRLVGIFSERDLLTKVAGQVHDYASRSVADFMTRQPE